MTNILDITFLVITLKDCPERMKYTKKLLTKHGLSHKIFTFKKNKIGWIGCLDSHIQLYKYAIKNKLRYIFILEDNVCLSPYIDINNDFKRLFTIIKNKTDWDIILLGGFFSPLARCDSTEYSTLYKSTNTHGTSCYVINYRTCYRLIKQYKKGINQPIDVYISKNFRQFIYRPLLFYHRIVDSVTNPRFDLIRKFWFNPAIYRTVEIWFFEDKLQVITVYMASLLIFVIFLIATWFKSNKIR